MKTPLYNKRKQLVGYYDKTDDSYFTSRDALLSQIFLKPEFKGMIAIDKEIVEQLEKLGCNKLIFLILNWDYKEKRVKPNISYIIYFEFNKFLNSSELINYSMTKMGGLQYRIKQEDGMIVDTEQTKLTP